MRLPIQRAVLATAVLATLSQSAGAQLSATPTFFQIDPRSSFYRAGGETPPGPTVIALSGLAGGSVLTLSASGQMQAAGAGSPVLNVANDYFSALFSGSSTVLATTLLNRVPGALPLVGGITPLVTGPTFYGGLATDIAQDFGIVASGMSVVVPDGAQYLLVSWYDNYYSDNVSPNPSQLGVTISATSTVPEPMTVGLVGVGLAGLALVGRRRGRA